MNTISRLSDAYGIYKLFGSKAAQKDEDKLGF